MKVTRIILVILVSIFPLALAAQSNEVGIFLSQPHMQSESLFIDPGITASIEFDGDLGFGAEYNRFWTDHFSTEFALSQLKAGTTFTLSAPGVSESFDAGDIELTTLSGIAQWHFTGGSRFAPYVGAGLVYVSGKAETTADPTDPTAPTDNVDLESETSAIVNAGLDIRVSPKVSLALDVRYFSYDANEEGDPDAESLGLDTFVYSAGVKFRF